MDLEKINEEIRQIDGVHDSEVHKDKIIVHFIDNSLSFDKITDFRRHVKQVLVSHNSKVENIEICGMDGSVIAVIILKELDRKYLIDEILRIAGDEFEDTNDFYDLAIKEEKDLITQLYNLYYYKNV